MLIPEDQASIPEAKEICQDKGLELMSLSSLVELGPVQDLIKEFDIPTNTILTSMKKVTDGGTNWLGDLASALLPPNDPSKDGDCLGLSALGLEGISCDTVSNFVCQVPDPPGAKPRKTTAKQRATTKSNGWRTVFNSPSDKIVRIGTKKYKFPNEMATFTDAEKICKKDQMEIASLDSPSEAADISDYLQYIDLLKEPVFSSFSSLIEEGAKLLSNWGSDDPPGGPGDCLVQQDDQYFNSSCDTENHFICEDPIEEDSSTMGISSLTSIEDAILNFVGGKNVLIPNNLATIPEAKTICKSKGLELMSLNSIAQLEPVKGLVKNLGLSSSTLLTAMTKLTSGGSNLLGDLASAILPPKDPSKDGDCLGLSALGLKGISCDTVSNFVCQVPDQPGMTTRPPKKTTTKPMADSIQFTFQQKGQDRSETVQVSRRDGNFP
ncbi:Hypothetical predicted protein [Cloeon dipterum]|uniref:C-type lectin domain-containing protein n=1 Tax=Cloeon dipterum TaxID=197152 RepID=A0A8S1E2B2_9INSE|nr:Hypothetical predicted protein [Cloeon dipterum]